jgi:cytosine/adenosine deaminase-related metal-dependent hydrolase
VAAGPELNLWQVLRSALEAQIARSFYQEGDLPTPVELFSLVTSAAARALGKSSEIGSIEPGKAADLVVIDLGEIVPGGRRANFEADYSGEDLLSMLIYRGGPQATLATYVRGKRLYAAPQPALL